MYSWGQGAFQAQHHELLHQRQPGTLLGADGGKDCNGKSRTSRPLLTGPMASWVFSHVELHDVVGYLIVLLGKRQGMELFSSKEKMAESSYVYAFECSLARYALAGF